VVLVSGGRVEIGEEREKEEGKEKRHRRRERREGKRKEKGKFDVEWGMGRWDRDCRLDSLLRF